LSKKRDKTAIDIINTSVKSNMSTIDHPLSVTTLDLINTGILMGFIHVLTGPDHLAAVATLVGTSLSSSSSTTEGGRDQGSSWRMSNFLLGIKWGIGHSLGLLVVGSVLIAIESGSTQQWISMDDTIQFVLDIIVGLAMLCLGCYGMIRAIRHRNEHEDVEFNNRRRSDDDGNEDESIELNKAVSSPSSRRASSTTTTRRSNSGRGSKSSSRKSRSNSNSIREEEEDSNLLSSAAARDEDSSFFKDPEMAMDCRRASMEIIHQMSEVLNRDGDSLRRGDSTVVDPSDTADVEKRILEAAKSLHQNSDLSNDHGSRHGKSKRSTPSSSSDEEQGGLKRNVSEEQFLRTLKTSAKGALSKSFMAILSDERTSGAQPLSANSLMNKVVDDQHHSILEEMSGSHSTRSGTLLRRCLSSSCCCVSSRGSCSPGLLAVLVGIIQGVAGTSAVLGVIPAVQLENPKFSAIYLSTFCFTSTLVMGVFAFFYGFFSSWLAGDSVVSSRGRRRASDDLSSSGSRIFVVEAGSAVLSVAVGIIWLVLLSVGNLEPLRSRI